MAGSSLSSMRPSSRAMRGEQDMTWGKTLFAFLFTFAVVWSLILTFHPTFLLSDNDFITDIGNAANDGDQTASTNNKVLSDRGRVTAFLWALVLAILVSIVMYFVSNR